MDGFIIQFDMRFSGKTFPTITERKNTKAIMDVLLILPAAGSIKDIIKIPAGRAGVSPAWFSGVLRFVDIGSHPIHINDRFDLLQTV